MAGDLVLGATSLDPQERAAAIRSLGELHRVDGIQALIFALATAEPATADLAVVALASIGAPAEAALRAALAQESDDFVRDRLQDALSRLTLGAESP